MPTTARVASHPPARKPISIADRGASPSRRSGRVAPMGRLLPSPTGVLGECRGWVMERVRPNPGPGPGPGPVAARAGGAPGPGPPVPQPPPPGSGSGFPGSGLG